MAAPAFLKARQTKYAVYATMYIVVVFAIITVANVLANRYNKSYDSTANKRYSLSEQTAKIVKGLKQNATITYFDDPGRFQAAKDQLDQYANLSPKVKVSYVDSMKNPQLVRAFNVKNPGTAIVQIGDKKEEAKSLTEEGITGAFIRDLKDKTRTICFVTGSGERRIDNSEPSGNSQLKELLSRDEYEAKSISLLEKAEVPADCTVVVVAGPTSDYLQPEVDALKKYVEDGGRALFMLDPPLKIGRSEIADNNLLAGVLASWGVSLQKDLVLDLNPIGQLMGLGPQVALVRSYASQPIVNDLQGTATGFPLVRSMDIKSEGKSTVEKLFASSDSSLATTKLNSPDIDPNDPKNIKGPLTIAAAGSYNTGKENSQGRFVVVGSATWAANSFLGWQGNRDLALNMMNWLASDEDLISIRPKAPEDRKITMTRAQMSMVRITSQFVIPLIVIFAGVSVWWRRR
jgi:ABC-type uncharacterized transport system involved in gliding motility auxiliary subunit